MDKERDAYRKDSEKKSINWDKPGNGQKKVSTATLKSKDKQC